MLEWFSGLVSTPERHGGKGGGSPVSNTLAGFESLSGFLPGFRAVFVAVVLALLLMLLTRRRASWWPHGAVALLFALVASVLLGTQESETRDFVVLLPLLGFSIAWLNFVFGESLRGSRRALLGAGMNLIVIGLVGLSVMRYVGFMNQTSVVVNKVVANAQSLETFETQRKWALGYNVWTPGNALLFGANDAVMFGVEESDHLLDREIGINYPGALHFDHWNGQIRRVDEFGLLTDLTCMQVKDLAEDDSLGVVVDSPGHVSQDSLAGGDDLFGGTGLLVPNGTVGDYFAYKVSKVECP